LIIFKPQINIKALKSCLDLKTQPQRFFLDKLSKVAFITIKAVKDETQENLMQKISENYLRTIRKLILLKKGAQYSLSREQ